MRKKILTIILLVAALVAGIGMIRATSDESKLPEFDEAWFVPLPKAGEKKSKSVALRDRASVRAIFDGVRRDRSPSKWAYWGRLELLRYKTTVATVEIFRNPAGEGPFRLGERDYHIGYDQEAFSRLLKATPEDP